jgi:hypothetical protein
MREKDMLRKSSLSILSALGLVGFCTFPLNAYATTTKSTIPYDFIAPDFCTGENVHWTGTGILTLVEAVNDKTSHVSSRFTLNLDGTGLTTGGEYQAISESTNQSTASLSPSGFFVLQIITTATVITPQSLPNDIVKSQINVTINADGTVTAEVVSFSSECVGHKT